jgi:hypothetical protein
VACGQRPACCPQLLTILFTVAKQGPNFLSCMLNRAKRVLLISVLNCESAASAAVRLVHHGVHMWWAGGLLSREQALWRGWVLVWRGDGCLGAAVVMVDGNLGRE